MNTVTLTIYINIFIALFFLAGCNKGAGFDSAASSGTRREKAALNKPVPETSAPAAPVMKPADVQIEIGNTRYLFVLADHSTEDLKALLTRADEIAQTSLDHFGNLEIELVIHGPTVEMFTQKNYPKNKELIDLAAKLDAFNVIDLKICEKSLASRGLSRDDIPAFIESVPYAPDEIKRLTQDGYINL